MEGLKRAVEAPGAAGCVESFTLDDSRFVEDFGSQPYGAYAAIDSVLVSVVKCAGGEDLLARSVDSLRKQVELTMGLEALRARLLPRFEAAFARKNMTAWVGANDYVALEALTFLRKRGMEVPRRISVLGFDDSYEAFSQRLTSYSFACPAVIHAMVGYITGREQKSARGRKGGSVEIEGYVVERRTTGPARTTAGE